MGRPIEGRPGEGRGLRRERSRKGRGLRKEKTKGWCWGGERGEA
jgi:hypothetical protein